MAIEAMSSVHATDYKAGEIEIGIVSNSPDEDAKTRGSWRVMDDSEVEAFSADRLADAALVIVTRSAGLEIIRLLRAAESRPDSVDVLVLVEPEGQAGRTETSNPGSEGTQPEGKAPFASKVLYLNGHPLLNTRLLI